MQMECSFRMSNVECRRSIEGLLEERKTRIAFRILRIDNLNPFCSRDLDSSRFLGSMDPNSVRMERNPDLGQIAWISHDPMADSDDAVWSLDSLLDAIPDECFVAIPDECFVAIPDERMNGNEGKCLNEGKCFDAIPSSRHKSRSRPIPIQDSRQGLMEEGQKMQETTKQEIQELDLDRETFLPKTKKPRINGASLPNSKSRVRTRVVGGRVLLVRNSKSPL